jgi:tetratricopeptide (TPR) repeat protein
VNDRVPPAKAAEVASALTATRKCVAEGDLAGAEKLLNDVARTPAGREDAELNHLFGQVLHDLGKLDRAITHYRRSLRLVPANAELHRDLGVAYETKSWLKEATECFREAVRLDPDDDLAHSYLGRVLKAQGEITSALRHFTRAASLKVTRPLRALWRREKAAAPSESEKQGHLAEARAAVEARRLPEAESKVRALIESNERDADALALYARICGKTNRFDQGIQYAQRAIAAQGANADFHVTLGELLFGSERFDEAAVSFEAAIRLDAEHATAWANLALAEQKRDRAEEADRNSRRAIELDPASAHVSNVRAYVLLSAEKFKEAEPYCREAIRLEPGSSGPYLNLAHSFKEQGRIDEARAMVGQGARRLSDEATSYCHLAAFEFDMGQIDEAIEHTRRALMLESGHSDAHMTLANLLLLSGRYEGGWQEYEWRKRYRRQAVVHEFFRARLGRFRQWAGTDLEGKRLLVHCEQALGEQILFFSCLPELVRRAKSTTLLCDERLQKLFSRSLPQIRVVAVCREDQLHDYQPEAEYDYWCANGSLPGLLNLRAPRIPPATAYLKPDDAKVERWRARLAGLGPGLKVGISWRGGVIPTGRFKRSMDLATLRPMFEVPGVHWVSMQYTKVAEEIALLREATGIEITHWQEGIDDFEEHAALAAALDHRISACNTLVHLSGAMGLRTWVLSPPATIWPYGLASRMPWYPSVTIYRQKRYKDWSEPIANAARDLRALAAQRG